MILFHYTSAEHLRGIARCGLTVGDVPTDIPNNRGRVGVWLTSEPTSNGHGLEHSKVDKKRYRLTVSVPDSPVLVRWSEWAPRNVTSETIYLLNKANGEGAASWYIYFGVVMRTAITSCVDMTTGEEVLNWGEVCRRIRASERCPHGGAMHGIVNS